MQAAEQTALLEVTPPVTAARVARAAPRETTVRHLCRWARAQMRLIAGSYRFDTDSHAFVLAQAVKLGEEVGELHAEVLGRAKYQRSSKTARFNDETLKGELADVLICVAILAEATGVDLATALEETMAAIDARAG